LTPRLAILAAKWIAGNENPPRRRAAGPPDTIWEGPDGLWAERDRPARQATARLA